MNSAEPDLTGLDPVSVAGWLGNGLPPRLVSRLLALPRFGSRLAGIVDNSIGAMPDQPSPAQAAAMALDGWALHGLALRIGAVWYAQFFARLIDGASVRALVAAIGPELRRIALSHRDLAPTPEAGDAPDIATMAEAMEGAGLACLRAWCLRQPRSVALRLELRLPPGQPDPETDEGPGPAIVETLLQEMPV